MASLEHTVGLWVKVTSRALGQLERFKELGFDWVVVRMVEHPGVRRTRPYAADDLKRLLAAAVGLPVLGWAYVYPQLDLNEQARVIHDTLPLGAGHLLVDAEGEWENYSGAGPRADAMLRGLFGLDGVEVPQRCVIRSTTTAQSGRSASTSISHGGFHDDPRPYRTGAGVSIAAGTCRADHVEGA